jgi:hypothetical protein
MVTKSNRKVPETNLCFVSIICRRYEKKSDLAGPASRNELAFLAEHGRVSLAVNAEVAEFSFTFFITYYR